MPESIELIDLDEAVFESLQTSRRIKLRKESFSVIIKEFQDFLRSIKDKTVESIEKPQDKKTVAADITVTKLAPVSKRLNDLVDLLDIDGSNLGLRVANKAIKIKEKMRTGMKLNMAGAKELAEKSVVPSQEQEREEQRSNDSSEIRVSKNESSVARIEKYAAEAVDKKDNVTEVTSTYDQERTMDRIPVVEASLSKIQHDEIKNTAEPVVPPTEIEREDTAEPVVPPTEIEREDTTEIKRETTIDVKETTLQEGYTAFKMESADINKLVRECARKKEESESIAAEKQRAEQAAIEAEQACLRARQELQDKYKEVEERTRLLEEKNRREKAEIKALQDQQAQYQNSTQSFVSSIDALNAMLSETAQPEQELKIAKAA